MPRGQARSVTCLPPTINPLTHLPKQQVKKRRVAGYARVSTDSDEQFTSYEAQIRYYTDYIKSHSDWKFVSVYTDEGISGTSTKRRKGFNQMIKDALAGKIDLIVTKSVSRFARNTVDSLVTIRKLKDAGCECFFEKENIYTFDKSGELLLTIMSSLAQEESRSISENVTWGKRQKFSEGKFSMPYNIFLGYEKGEDGLPKVVPEEAKVVRLIYRRYIEGKSESRIADELTALGVKTPGKKDVWPSTTITSILTNEKYKGSALLQKTYTESFLTKKAKKNNGEINQYYIENSHEAIIPPEEWEAAQQERAIRKIKKHTIDSRHALSQKVVCEDCGDFYGPKTWHSTDKYKKVVWQCNSKFKGKKKCTTPTFKEEDIKGAFVDAVNELIDVKDDVIDDCRMLQDSLSDFSSLDSKVEKLRGELDEVYDILRKLIKDNANQVQDQKTYDKIYTEYEEKANKLQEEINSLKEIKSKRQLKSNQIGMFMFELKELNSYIKEFDNSLFRIMVDKVIVHKNGDLEFKFYNI